MQVFMKSFLPKSKSAEPLVVFFFFSPKKNPQNPKKPKQPK